MATTAISKEILPVSPYLLALREDLRRHKKPLSRFRSGELEVR